MQLKTLLQNKIVNYLHLTLVANLSLRTLIEMFLFILTLLVAFSSSLKKA